MSNAYDEQTDGQQEINKWNALKANQLRLGLTGIPGVGFRPQGFSTTVFKEGSTYYARSGTTGEWISNVSAATLLNNARATLPGTDYEGTMFVRRATYDINADFMIGRKTRLIAEPGAIFNVTGNLAEGCIVVDDSTDSEAKWGIDGVEIDFSNLYNGHGIYSDHAAPSGGYASTHIKNTVIKNIKSGYWGVALYDPSHLSMDNMRIHTYGGGVFLGVETGTSYRANYGNLSLNQIKVSLAGNSTTGFHFKSSNTAGLYLFQKSRFSNLEVLSGSASYTGTVGIMSEGIRYCQFDHPIVENAVTGMYFKDCDTGATNCYDVKVTDAEMIGMPSGGDCVYMAEGADDLTFQGGTFAPGSDAAAGGQFYHNASSSGMAEFIGSKFHRSATGSETITPGASRFHHMLEYYGRGLVSSPISGSYVVDIGGSGSFASGVAYNNRHSDKAVYINGGTVSSIESPSGTQIFTATGRTVYLSYNTSIRITWSVAPTIVVYALG